MIDEEPCQPVLLIAFSPLGSSGHLHISMGINYHAIRIGGETAAEGQVTVDSSIVVDTMKVDGTRSQPRDEVGHHFPSRPGSSLSHHTRRSVSDDPKIIAHATKYYATRTTQEWVTRVDMDGTGRQRDSRSVVSCPSAVIVSHTRRTRAIGQS